MKRFIFLILSVFILWSCEEEGPYINFTPEYIDTSLVDSTFICIQSATPEPKKVILEDFTGVQCTNCPKAHAVIQQILSGQDGDRVLPVAIHVTDDFGKPHGGSKEDYRIPEGAQIYSMLQGDGTLPRGDVDRNTFNGETEIILDRSKWVSYVGDRLTLNSIVNIDIKAEYLPAEKSILIEADLHYTEAVSGNNFLSVMIVENNIVDLQSKPGGIIDSFYLHNHMLRDMATPYNGRLLMDSPELNRRFIIEFKIKVKDNWKLDDLHVIAFVHKGASDYYVLNAEEAEVQ